MNSRKTYSYNGIRGEESTIAGGGKLRRCWGEIVGGLECQARKFGLYSIEIGNKNEHLEDFKQG